MNYRDRHSLCTLLSLLSGVSNWCPHCSAYTEWEVFLTLIAQCGQVFIAQEVFSPWIRTKDSKALVILGYCWANIHKSCPNEVTKFLFLLASSCAEVSVKGWRTSMQRADYGGNQSVWSLLLEGKNAYALRTYRPQNLASLLSNMQMNIQNFVN